MTHPTLVFASLDYGDLHDTGPGHPEQAARMEAVISGIADTGLGEAVQWSQGRMAQREELLLAHDGSYLNSLADFIAGGGDELDPDTPVSIGSWDAARHAAGSGLAAIDALDQGQAPSAFVAVRPPGHHATRHAGMGFCLINNVAVAAAALAARGERVLIVDWDVHHGNGTQDIFWDDPSVMYASIHEWPSYPGTGRPQDLGGSHARGLTVNVPLPPGATGDVARQALDEVIIPEAVRFGPTWVLISAGFDAHRDDPLAGLEWSAGDYADLTRAVGALAPHPGRLIAFLEGGYDLDALSRSVGATVSALSGEDYRPEAATSGGPGRDIVAGLAIMRSRAQEDSGWQ